MRRSKLMPEVNAGSMADIAFLLLIFFLVTAVIPKDHGFNRKLPKPCPPNTVCDETINERNVLRITINSQDEIMVETDIVKIDKLKEITKEFLDNNGDGSCTYCQGKKLSDSSDSPKEAVISLKSDSQSTYSQFIGVQDEITKAYYELREAYAKGVLNKAVDELSPKELQNVKDAYPFILSEAQIK